MLWGMGTNRKYCCKSGAVHSFTWTIKHTLEIDELELSSLLQILIVNDDRYKTDFPSFCALDPQIFS